MSMMLYVERREEGDYVVRKPRAKHASAVATTQKEAIKMARELGAKHPLVERVRRAKNGSSDKWRKV